MSRVWWLQCVINYDIVGEGLAGYLFAVHETTGVIRSVRALTDDRATQYKVSALATLQHFNVDEGSIQAHIV